MTELSPAAKAVDDAFWTTVYGKFDIYSQRRARLAAALSAAADQVVPYEATAPWNEKKCDYDGNHWEMRQWVRDKLLAIAAELKGAQPASAMTWQPIKTAPRDGQFFIGANAKESIICNWPKQAQIDYAPGNWRRSRGEWDGSFIPTKSPLTHWRSLPSLPDADENSNPTSGKN